MCRCMCACECVFILTVWKVSKYGVFSGPYFPAFGLNTERYEVSLRIQSECGKIRTRKYSVFGHFSRSDSSTVEAFSVWNDALETIECKDQRSCVVGILLDDSAKFLHLSLWICYILLKRKTSGAAMNRKQNDMIMRRGAKMIYIW